MYVSDKFVYFQNANIMGYRYAEFNRQRAESTTSKTRTKLIYA